jgi:hypothetical protein
MIDAEGRKKRASEAGKASGEKRKAATRVRDVKIYLAYKFLIGQYQEKNLTGLYKNHKERSEIVEFITGFGKGVNLGKGESPLTFLADRVGVTRERIFQIIKKERERSSLK